MRMSQLVGRTMREAPRDSELPSHKFLVRAGYVKQYSSGIYGFLPLAWRSIQKIEAICREEMNAIEGQEVRMPTLATRELWEETGRYGSIGKELFRLKDRHEKDHVLCMTHEEPVVYIARTELTSYKQLPAMLYQFQTKFRDEPRPRGGLVRTREFIMKDAYSFHPDEASLLEYYDRAHKAYERFYKRVGFKNFASVKSDNGIFGGKFSHEFMALSPFGEDTLITCPTCDYRANVEVAVTKHKSVSSQAMPLTELQTPGCKTIDQLVAFLATMSASKPQPSLPAKVSAAHTCKAVLFQTAEQKLVAVFVRGDRDVTEQKLVTLLGKQVFPAQNATLEAAGAVAGSTGPLFANSESNSDLKACKFIDPEKVTVVFDLSLQNEASLVVGACKTDVHLAGFNIERDYLARLSPKQKSLVVFADVCQVVAGDACPQCNGALTESRGIEIGNIFHLGTKYSSAMQATFLDQTGKKNDLVMGCYGIGISRVLAALIEEHHDEHGMILPMPVAPFQVQLNALNLSDESVRSAACKIYEALLAAGIEVLFDDRDEKPGSQFADADLIGLPLRVVVAPRSLKAGMIEIKYRDKSAPGKEFPLSLEANTATESLQALVGELKKLVAAENQKYAL